VSAPIVFDEERGVYVMLCGEERISIEALPELLEALRTLQGMGLGRNAYAICSEAIAKATGSVS
jgi:hypothetical protein